MAAVGYTSGDPRKVDVAGDTMTGDLVLSGSSTDLTVGGDLTVNGTISGSGALGWINVKTHGASGNGTADDTAALQAALDAVPASGGTVYIPAGTYLANPTTGLTPKANTVIIGDGYSSVIKIPDGHNSTGNLLRLTNCDNIVVTRIRLDGNRANQASGNNYGLFFDSCVNGRIDTVWMHSFTGVGLQAYDCDSSVVTNCVSWDNLYHGFECEQCRGCTFEGNTGRNNDRHGIFVSPGEVGGTGSLNNQIVGNSFHDNTQYGIALGEDAGGLSAFLSTGNVIVGNDVRGNTDYGIQLWKVNGNTVTGNSVYGNGKFGVYLYQAANNTVTGNVLTGNCQNADNAYDEILLEGYTDDNTKPSRYNLIAYNQIRATGVNQPRYGVAEATSSDGPNTVTYNQFTGTFDTGQLNIQNSATARSSPAGVWQVSGSQAISAAAGIDNAFGALRLVNDADATAEIQVVSTGTGGIKFYTGGTERLVIDGAAASLLIGGDTTLYRGAADVLQTDDSFMALGRALGCAQARDAGYAAWSYDYTSIVGGNTATAGVLYLNAIYIPYTVSVTKIHYTVTGAGNTPVSGQNFVAIYNASGTKLVEAGIDSSLGTGRQAVTISSTQLTAGMYWVAILANCASGPSIGSGVGNSTIKSTLFGTDPLTAATLRFATNGTSLTAAPASITPSSNSGSSSQAFWVAVA